MDSGNQLNLHEPKAALQPFFDTSRCQTLSSLSESRWEEKEELQFILRLSWKVRLSELYRASISVFLYDTHNNLFFLLDIIIDLLIDACNLLFILFTI